MNRILLSITILSLLVWGCDKNTPSNNNEHCDVDNPLTELQWLQNIVYNQEIEHQHSMTIHKCSYNKQQGFVIDFCVECPDSQIIFFDCDSSVICKFGETTSCYSFSDFKVKAEDLLLIYSDTIVADTNFCHISDPLTELKWLAQIVAENKNKEAKAEIYKCIYDDKEGFIINICVGCLDAIIEFRDCQGNVLCEFGGIMGTVTCPDFQEKLKDKELIWENH